MQLHELKRKTKNKKARQVGRGGKRGKTSGRGTKGQKARAGRKLRPEIRDVIKRLPKKRGYRFNSINSKPIVINLNQIESASLPENKVNPETLFQANLISKTDRGRKVKILSSGEIKKKIEVSGCTVSKSAKEKIEKAGGKISH